MHALFALLAGLVLAVLIPQSGHATEYFVSPPGTTLSDSDADGSLDHPFTSLAAALHSDRVTAGDTVRLMPGGYGTVTIENVSFDAPVFIAPVSGTSVHLTGLNVVRSRNLEFADFAIWPIVKEGGHIISTDTRSQGIVFRHIDLRVTEDALSYPEWTKDDWKAWARSGIIMRGSDNALLESRLTGLATAIAATGSNVRVEGNIVSGFSGDGIRSLGDGAIIQGNLVQDCVAISDNHDDGLQSWSRGKDGKPGGGVVRDLRIESNAFLEWTRGNNPLRCDLQGIGLFDGMFEDLVIRNNIVSVSAYHGITVAGATDALIVNNTVINARGPGKKFPWIGVVPHKNGTPPGPVVLANNITAGLRFNGPPAPTVRRAKNLITRYPGQDLVDPYRGDFRPKFDGGAEGTADPQLAPPVDYAGRPRGERPDVGALQAR